MNDLEYFCSSLNWIHTSPLQGLSPPMHWIHSYQFPHLGGERETMLPKNTKQWWPWPRFEPWLNNHCSFLMCLGGLPLYLASSRNLTETATFFLRMTSSHIFTHSSWNLITPMRFALMALKLKVATLNQTGISCRQRKLRILRLRNLKIGMISQRLMIQKTPNLRYLFLVLLLFPFLFFCYTLKTGFQFSVGWSGSYFAFCFTMIWDWLGS